VSILFVDGFRVPSDIPRKNLDRCCARPQQTIIEIPLIKDVPLSCPGRYLEPIDGEPVQSLSGLTAWFQAASLNVTGEWREDDRIALQIGEISHRPCTRPAGMIDTRIDNRSPQAEQHPIQIADLGERIGSKGAVFIGELLGMDCPPFDKAWRRPKAERMRICQLLHRKLDQVAGKQFMMDDTRQRPRRACAGRRSSR